VARCGRLVMPMAACCLQKWLEPDLPCSACSSMALTIRHARRIVWVVPASSLGPYLIEYRPAQRWDAGFPRSAVFVHSFADNHSYVLPATAGNYDLQAGDAFEWGVESFRSGGWTRVEVVAIDDGSLTASLRLSYRPTAPLPWSEIVGRIVGGVSADGGGGIIVGGIYHPIPPWGPENQIISQLAGYLGAAEINDVGLRTQVRQAALKTIGEVVSARSARLDPIRSPAPAQSDDELPS
jgi:hypothetical protein